MISFSENLSVKGGKSLNCTEPIAFLKNPKIASVSEEYEIQNFELMSMTG